MAGQKGGQPGPMGLNAMAAGGPQGYQKPGGNLAAQQLQRGIYAPTPQGNSGPGAWGQVTPGGLPPRPAVPAEVGPAPPTGATHIPPSPPAVPGGGEGIPGGPPMQAPPPMVPAEPPAAGPPTGLGAGPPPALGQGQIPGPTPPAAAPPPPGGNLAAQQAGMGIYAKTPQGNSGPGAWGKIKPGGLPPRPGMPPR